MPRIAKVKRASAAQEEFRRKMLAKAGQPDDHSNDAAGYLRCKPRRKTKIKSQGFRGHRKFDGTPAWRRP